MIHLWMMNWTHNSKEFIDSTGYYGFVYLITNTDTGRKYVGRKYFTKSKTKQVKGKKKRTRVDSDWIDYYGSSKSLLADIDKLGKDKFTRAILHLCKSRSECSYWESYEIFTRHALMSAEYYNDWISCRIRKAHLI